ncbi:phytoene synthase 2 [Pyrus ussuriensis x Pyrus communis]|uniref:Phytoene synthase 2 n=1 Tax=Pyrus ussuriensis x Pyrus communis TaxID=2448454 RepID=A0A5N5GIE1_9ROSA|nr:phytoene synthase 2 [Pyrus ussuriensis x Pyrus communis]
MCGESGRHGVVDRCVSGGRVSTSDKVVAIVVVALAVVMVVGGDGDVDGGCDRNDGGNSNVIGGSW